MEPWRRPLPRLGCVWTDMAGVGGLWFGAARVPAVRVSLAQATAEAQGRAGKEWVGCGLGQPGCRPSVYPWRRPLPRLRGCGSIESTRWTASWLKAGLEAKDPKPGSKNAFGDESVCEGARENVPARGGDTGKEETTEERGFRVAGSEHSMHAQRRCCASPHFAFHLYFPLLTPLFWWDNSRIARRVRGSAGWCGESRVGREERRHTVQVQGLTCHMSAAPRALLVLCQALWYPVRVPQQRPPPNTPHTLRGTPAKAADVAAAPAAAPAVSEAAEAAGLGAQMA
eukprot:363335-Chlamydomonas_euryale.AAC.6